MKKHIKYDYHIHTQFSLDSKAKLIDVVNIAINKGLKEIAITNHIEPNYDNGTINDKNFREHLNEIDVLKNQLGDKIKILKGAEITLLPNNEKKFNTFIKKYEDLDFVIGSSHCINKKDLYFDFDFSSYTKKEAYEIYLNEVIQCIPNNNFCVYGHLDFVSRYSKYEDPLMQYDEFSSLIDTALKLLIKHNKGLEVNTSGIKYGINSFYPSVQILKRYNELGGKILTVGSDSHIANNVGSHFDIAYEYLKKCGFNSITTFEKMKPKQIKI